MAKFLKLFYSDKRKVNHKLIFYLSLFIQIPLLLYFLYAILPEINGSFKTGIKIILFLLILLDITAFISFKLLFRPVRDIIKYAKTLSQGDLNVNDLVLNDESNFGMLATAFNDMKSSLLSFIEQTKNNILVISDSVDTLSKGTQMSYKGNEQASSTIQDIAFKTQEQLSLVKKTAENLDNVSKRVDTILKHIKNTESIARNTSTVTNSGIDKLNTYNEQINVISTDLNNTSDFLVKLKDSIKQITGVTDFINDISEKLKMLALNASIEAARAGEAGKGFNVVADETTKLSEAAMDGTDKIYKIIKAVLENSSSVEESIGECINSFEKSEKLFASVKDLFSKIDSQSDVILDSMNEINKETSNINDSAKDANALSSKLYNASNKVTSGTQEVAAAIEESVAELQEITKSSDGLSSMLKKIENLTSKFNTSVKPVDQKPSKRLKISIIYPCNAEFWNFIKQGIMYAKKELSKCNTDIESIEINEPSAENFKNAINDCIQKKYDGISVVGYYKETVPLINKAVESGIPVATFNSDLQDSKRIVFVGQNPYKAGEFAAHLMADALSREGKVGIITSDFNISGHQLRSDGFKNIIGDIKDMEIAFEREVHDNDLEAYKKTKELLSKFNDLRGIFICAGGISGVAKAVEELKLSGTIKIICFDFIDKTIEYIKKGVITASIGQDPFGQSYSSIVYLYNNITAGKNPPDKKMWTRMYFVNQKNVNDILM